MDSPQKTARMNKALLATSVMVLSLLVQSNASAQNENDKPNNRNQQSKRGNARNADRRGNPANMMRFLDKDKDGKISKDEAPERMAGRFDQIDANSDGFLDQTEMQNIFANRGNQSNRGAGGPNQTGPAKSKSESGDAVRGNRNSGDRAMGNGAMGRFDIAKLFKEMDKDGDGNLDPTEQQSIIERFKAMQERMRGAMGQRGGAGQSSERKGADRMKKAAENRFSIPKTDPVKPKRPGMDS